MNHRELRRLLTRVDVMMQSSAACLTLGPTYQDPKVSQARDNIRGARDTLREALEMLPVQTGTDTVDTNKEMAR